MANWLHKKEFTRRDVLLGAVGGLLGGIAASLTIEALTHDNPSPLTPENGDAQGVITIEWLPDTVTRWRPLIEKYARQYDIDPNLVAIIMTIESGGDPDADSGIASGLMQITAERAKDISSSFLDTPRPTYNLTDPETSIEFGAANIRHLIDLFGDPAQGPSWDKTVALVAAGYNGGEGAAIALRDKGLRGVESQQTHNYIRYTTTMWRERHDDKSFAYRYWYDQGNGRDLVEKARQR